MVKARQWKRRLARHLSGNDGRAGGWPGVSICCLVLLLTTGSCGRTRNAGPDAARGTQAYALFLGDSFGTGFHLTSVPAAGDATCARPSSMTSGSGGWFCVFVHFLRSKQPHLRFENVAVEGEDSCSFYTIRTYCEAISAGRAKSLRPAAGSQMARALAYLREHSGQVSPITFELGGNDQIVPGVPGLGLPAAESRIDHIIARLRQAAPNADLILMDYPHSPTPPPVFYRGEASRYRALFVDVHARFVHHPG